MARRKKACTTDHRTGRKRSPRQAALLRSLGYGQPTQERRDLGMMGHMKALGYDIDGCPVPPGFADWPKERRIDFMETWQRIACE